MTKVFADLLKKYPDRLTIETNTPVKNVEYDAACATQNAYTLHTSRGPLRAGNVIYATNGYTGHLLPRLRGRIHPFKGTMPVLMAATMLSLRAAAIVDNVGFKLEIQVAN